MSIVKRLYHSGKNEIDIARLLDCSPSLIDRIYQHASRHPETPPKPTIPRCIVQRALDYAPQ